MRVIMHVGPYKTGTTTIQHALSQSASQLLKEGICYPDTKPPSHEGHPALAWEILEKRGRPALRLSRAALTFEEALSQARGAGAHTMLLSAEDFSSEDFDAKAFALVRDALGDCQLKVVIGLRDPLAVVPSLWKQRVKVGLPKNIKEDRNAPLSSMVLNKAVPILMQYAHVDLSLLIDRLRNGLGNFELCYFTVPGQTGDSELLKRFGHACELPETIFEGLLNRPSLSLNRSLTDAQTAIMLRVNKAFYGDPDIADRTGRIFSEGGSRAAFLSMRSKLLTVLRLESLPYNLASFGMSAESVTMLSMLRDRIASLPLADEFIGEWTDLYVTDAKKLQHSTVINGTQADGIGLRLMCSAMIDTLDTFTRTENAVDYHATQAENWKRLAEERERAVDDKGEKLQDLQASFADLETARDWHRQQSAQWQALAEERAVRNDQRLAQLLDETSLIRTTVGEHMGALSRDLEHVRSELSSRNEELEASFIEKGKLLSQLETVSADFEQLRSKLSGHNQYLRQVEEDRAYAAELMHARDWFAEQATRWELAHERAISDYQREYEIVRQVTTAEIIELHHQIDMLRTGILGRALRLFRRGTNAARHPILAAKLGTAGALRRLGGSYPQTAERLERQAKNAWWALTRQHDRLLPLQSPLAVEGTLGVGQMEASATTLLEASDIIVNNSQHYDHEPLVSIVIPCFNYGRYVGEAVASATGQTFRDLEVIVVDGGSTDGETPASVAALEAATVRTFFRKDCHRAGSNRNFGIERARGKYVCCLDADDKLAPTYIEKAVFLAEHYGYDVVSAAVQMFGENTARYGVAENVDLEVLLDRNEVSTCGLFRKALWETAGGYRDHGDGSPATHVHEDWEFWIRLAAVGARFFNIERDHLFLYRIHGSGSLSHRTEVKPIEEQRQIIRAANQDIVTSKALERSLKKARTAVSVNAPLVNLIRHAGFPDKKSLLVALPWMVLGGAERLLSAVLNYLAGEGWKIAIITTLEPNASNGDTTSWFSAITPHIFHLPRYLTDVARRREFLDYLVASRGATRLLIAGSAFTYEQLPWLTNRHPHLKVFDLLFNTVGHTSNNRHYASFIDRHIVENTEVRDWLVEHGEAADRVVTIPSGVELPSKPKDSVDRALHSALGIKQNDIVVGFSGRWSSEKNPLGFVDIAERLANNRHIHFVMTGAGTLGDAIAQRIALSPHLKRRFHLLGQVPDLGKILASYDILVVPSVLDGRPLVVLEALAAGVAVVASRIGGLPELVIPGENGELCPPDNPAAFAQAIVDLQSDRRKLANYQRGARAFAEKHLDAGIMTKRYEALLSEPLCLASNSH